MGASDSQPDRGVSGVSGGQRNDSGQHHKFGTTQKSGAQIQSNELASEFQRRINSSQLNNTVAARHWRADVGSGSAGQMSDSSIIVDNVSRPPPIHLTAPSRRCLTPRTIMTERGRRGNGRISRFRKPLIFTDTDIFSVPPTLSAEEKCYDPEDTTLEFVDGDDDMDFECMDYKSLRARMSCGHTVTPMSLTKWCRILLDKGDNKFVCGQPDCDVEWPYEEVRKMALLTPEEIEYFEKKLSERTAYGYMHAKKCPGCKSSVVRTDPVHLRVLCTLCTADKKKTYEFCWQCLREWKDPHSDHCAYDDCIDRPLQILSTCPEITFKDVKNITGCPSIRACPICGLLLEHNRKQCKNIICPQCKEEFCFVCLKLTVECLETSDYYIPCSSRVAPRQTSIPVWKKFQTE